MRTLLLLPNYDNTIACTLTQYNEDTTPVTQLLRSLKAVTISLLPLSHVIPSPINITSTTLITCPTDSTGTVSHLASSEYFLVMLPGLSSHAHCAPVLLVWWLHGY